MTQPEINAREKGALTIIFLAILFVFVHVFSLVSVFLRKNWAGFDSVSVCKLGL